MQSRISYLILVFLALISFAQQAEAVSSNLTDANAPAFPYTAEVIGRDVYIRSGPGMNYYQCGKLNEPQRVIVVGRKYSWSQIKPPPGSFSWISKQYVKPDPDNAGIGIISGDNVRIWAGSKSVEPMRSDFMQTKVNTGDTVRLLGEEKGGYYKIAPPRDAYLWVSTQYMRYLGPTDEVELSTGIPPVTEESKTVAEPNGPSVVSTTISVESDMLKKYYSIAEQIEAERAKPAADQNYADFKKALLAIVENKDAGLAVRYAEYVLGQIERFDLALWADAETKRQDANLAQVRRQIQTACQAKLDSIVDLGRFIVVGQLQPSPTYQAERYLIVDEQGRIICYTQPSQSAEDIDLSQFMHRKVGLTGTVEADSQTSTSLVRFDEIVELD